VLGALPLIFLFPLTKGFNNPTEKTQYYYLQLITLVGAVIGAKLGVLMGDALWPLHSFDNWQALLWSGRSIISALLFGFIISEIANPLLHYKRLPNDRFAIVLPFSIAIGRIGCWFSGCCLGHESDSPFAIQHIDGLTRFPIALYEILFHIPIGLIFIYFYHTGRFKGTNICVVYKKSDANKFSLLITDQTMPKFTGTELIEQIHKGHVDLPVILCTGCAGTADFENTNMANTHALSKPVEADRLIRLAAELLEDTTNLTA